VLASIRECIEGVVSDTAEPIALADGNEARLELLLIVGKGSCVIDRDSVTDLVVNRLSAEEPQRLRQPEIDAECREHHEHEVTRDESAPAARPPSTVEGHGPGRHAVPDETTVALVFRCHGERA